MYVYTNSLPHNKTRDYSGHWSSCSSVYLNNFNRGRRKNLFPHEATFVSCEELLFMMELYEPDPLTDKLLAYFRRRRYIDGDVILKPDLNITPEENILLSNIEKDTSRPNVVTFSTAVTDIGLAEQQFNLFKNWIAELSEEQCQNELSPVLMPLLFHLYLDSLRSTPRPSSLKFLKRLSSSIVTEEWSQLYEQLVSLHSSLDISNQPLVKLFRESKYEVNVSSRSIALLRKFLSSKTLHILIPSFQTWFEFTVSTEDILSSEEEMPTSGMSGNCDEEEIDEHDDEEYTTVTDKDMVDLMNEINNKRLQPTPPPPLLLYTAHKTEGIVCGRVSGECKLAATGDQKSEVRVWGLGDTKLTPQLHPSYFSSVPLAAFTEPINDSKLQNEKQMWSLRGHSDTVYDVAFLSDSEYLISVSFDSTMRLWKLSDYSCAAVYRGHSSPVWGVAVSPIANYVATASHDKTARLWSLDRTFPLRIMAGHHQDVTCVAFHPNGSYLATGSPDRTLRLWSVTDGSLVRVLGCQPGQGAVGTVAFSPNGQYVASAGDDRYVWLWDLARGSLIQQLAGHTSRVISVDWSHDGSTVSASGFDGTVLLWSLDNQNACDGEIEPKKYVTQCSTLLSLQYSTKNALVAVGLS
ncbi:TAF5-like RNA polymerase II p300/CBP-associated factor-associated factor 65 kDa subunit 5L [Halyomorpha halys]|uniref:TAF5-like RNA polymerase II p300/CBP-associated factor-associated factor 65 kDa subunit 5L n=1 Tax=Halyomorpha halys TaxID=286706 RepID=UPI0034D1857B